MTNLMEDDIVMVLKLPTFASNIWKQVHVMFCIVVFHS
jgi:hypothetical protein